MKDIIVISSITNNFLDISTINDSDEYSDYPYLNQIIIDIPNKYLKRNKMEN